MTQPVYVIVVTDILGDDLYGLPEAVSVELDKDDAWKKAQELQIEVGKDRTVGILYAAIDGNIIAA